MGRETRPEDLQGVKNSHKKSMKTKVEVVWEGGTKTENRTLLNSIYTDLYITEGPSQGTNAEHEVQQIEKKQRGRARDMAINYKDIFKPLPGQEKTIKTVMTQGVAGIGKTMSVHKFILDWAEDKANQDVDFIFLLPFRELNLIQNQHCSLHELLQKFHKELKNSEKYVDCKLVFIFDGLDESRFQLNLNTKGKCDATRSSESDTACFTVNVIIRNLIEGKLLPNALIWITSRPAAVGKIPAELISQVTEMRGFNDEQKDAYFRKRVRDGSLAEKIISQIKLSRSLYIMCHIPIFCWISATVLQAVLGKDNEKGIPRTLTAMFAHFLIIQTTTKNQKYDEGHEGNLGHQRVLQSNKESILKLAKLAFIQLEKGQILFYAEDLEDCGIDASDATVCSGMCSQIFKEESEFQLKKIYCFVHLSIQEFLAAFHVFYSYVNSDMEALRTLVTRPASWFCIKRRLSLYALLNAVVDKSLESENGHLDLFLRFLMGISLESNQELLHGILSSTVSSSESLQGTSRHIKEKVSGETSEPVSPERAWNLLYCLLEVNDTSLHEELDNYVKSNKRLSPAHCSALAYILLASEDVKDELDVDKYNTSSMGRERLIPAVKICRKARLVDCNLTETSSKIVASALQDPNSYLTELNLSFNDLQHGEEQIAQGLASPFCKLTNLRMQRCNLTEMSCRAVASALKSDSSCLKVLDLSNNDLQEPWLKHLTTAMQDERCKLEILELYNCKLTDQSCEHLASVIRSASSCLTEMDLSVNDLEDSGAMHLSQALLDDHSKVKTLKLWGCKLTDQSCAALVPALKCGSSRLTKLNLSDNELHDSGTNLLSDALADPRCKLEKLQLENCKVTDQSCTDLASALWSDSSRMKELMLRNNQLKDSGVELLSKALEQPHCQLETLQLQGCQLTARSCEALSTVLRSDSSRLTELDLSDNDLLDPGVELLSAALDDPGCKLEKLQLQGCKLTARSCETLSTVLRSVSSRLTELDLSDNDLRDSGVKRLSAALQDPRCKLQKLQLRECNLASPSCGALASAIQSNSDLKELNLSGNNLQNSGAKRLLRALREPRCNLEKLLTDSGDLVKLQRGRQQRSQPGARSCFRFPTQTYGRR
ncbi:NACHT, LRR and PYD domains-containing protein 3-like isoform X1 [Denticeps clupeoides]|uniref:FISNA domain-containing protein n=2 Tax=Denticeps clupeoides TaxID=299321 RepID=A0AAY4CCG1_9TELE|nr:NACHT, LRR and PYD domains-containing protein 3-like isoform X1 [Denticeps clupeoides]XP_028820888.1 NACHT, LRR and PYD domains-containing protein 3-like isoform X1 [Denticeps clupeoides]